MIPRGRRAVALAAVAVLLAAIAALVAGRLTGGESESGLPWKAKEFLEEGSGGKEVDKEAYSQGVANGGAGGEAFEALTAATQFANARTAPNGIVAPGVYAAEYAKLLALPVVGGGSWTNITRGIVYDADDPNYRDYFSNSSGGAGGTVTGRITGLTADGAGYVYAAGANGGVWRRNTAAATPTWTPIADQLPSLSSGDLQLDGAGRLWYATGEANTGGTSYVGSGVYRLDDPRTGAFGANTASRVGGTELESTTINAIRFDKDGNVWLGTSRGVYYRSANAATSTAWTQKFAPNPSYLPGGANAGSSSAYFKNIVNDVAIDPKNPSHVIAAAGWRNGDAFNGFYETVNGGSSWVKVNPSGAINPKDIGNVTFAFSKAGEKLYAINQSPILLNKASGTVNSYLDGIYVSNTGSPAGPWNKIADQHKLANSGSALKQSVSGKGYGPGIQSWYNQFLVVDPTNPEHLYAGLEEVYETKNGGSSWTTAGPYWNFYFSCWAPDSVYPPNGAPNRCPLTTHPDQHSAAVGTTGGKLWVYIGNDGGVYRRPVNGAVNANGNATDWQSLNDGTIDALQYYAVDAGLANGANTETPAGTGAVVSGGLQDNGGSILRLGGPKMSSNFGGDGGDVLVDPTDGCNIVQEYVFLSMRVTNTCASPNDPTFAPFLDLSKSTTWDIAPPDVNARFIAPFVDNDTNASQWLAGGASVWYQDKGYAIRSGSEWKKVHSWANAGQTTTALAFRGSKAIAAWCGGCNPSGFARGFAVGTLGGGGTWTWTNASSTTLAGLPNRYVSGAAVDASGTLYLGFSGFSRAWAEGPGAGVGHVYKSTDNGATWTNISGNLPDLPVNSIQVDGGSIVVGTDLGVLVSTDGGSTWSRLGSGFPATTVLDVELGPDGALYAATHGRGLWRIPFSG